MSTRDQRALFYDLVGTLRETKVFGFRGKYSCKAETAFTDSRGYLVRKAVSKVRILEPPRGCNWILATIRVVSG